MITVYVGGDGGAVNRGRVVCMYMCVMNECVCVCVMNVCVCVVGCVCVCVSLRWFHFLIACTRLLHADA